MSQLCLSIDSDLANMSIVAVAVNRICQYAGFDNIGAYQVELCVTEAMTNAILHAYHGERGHTVLVRIEVDSDRMLLEIRDNGTPMPSDQVERLIAGSKQPDPDDADPASIKEGGRGLQIMHDLMDEVGYFREDAANRLLLMKRIRVATSDRDD